VDKYSLERLNSRRERVDRYYIKSFFVYNTRDDIATLYQMFSPKRLTRFLNRLQISLPGPLSLR
jgi:hypothetical protein